VTVRLVIRSALIFKLIADTKKFYIHMRWYDIPRNPETRTLRQFAGLCLLIFGGLAVWNGVVHHRPVVAGVFAVLALGIGVPGLVAPRVVRPVFVGWMVLAFPIGWVVSHITLALLFYGLFTPIGLVMRLAGRDPLCLRPGPTTESYWTPRAAPADVRRYFRQY
jgi:hypothetical protein